MPFIYIEKKYVNNGTIHHHSHNDTRYISESKVSNRQKSSRLLRFLVSIGILMLITSL